VVRCSEGPARDPGVVAQSQLSRRLRAEGHRTSPRRGAHAMTPERPQVIAGSTESAQAPRRLVIVESPYAAKEFFDRVRNQDYARAALRDSLLRGEAPFASHLLYTQAGVLDDDIP